VICWKAALVIESGQQPVVDYTMWISAGIITPYRVNTANRMIVM